MTRTVLRALAAWRPGRLITNAAHAGSWNALRIALQAGSLVLLARALGAQGYGDLTGSLAVFITAGQFCGLGVGVALVRQMARHGESVAWVKAAQRVYAGTGLLLLVPAVVLAWSLFGDLVPAPALLLLAAAEMLVAPALMPFVFREQARERLWVSGGLLTVAPIARMLAAILAFVAGKGDLSSFAMAYAGSLTLIVGIVTWQVRERERVPRGRRIATAVALREGAPFAFGAAATTAGNELDKTVLLHLLGGVATGHYAAAHRVILAATLPVNSLVLAATPRLFRQQPQATRLGRHLVVGAVVYAGLSAAALWLFAPWLHWLLGEDFRESSLLLRTMVPLVMASCLRQAVMAQLTTADLQRARNMIEGGAAVLSVCALLVAVPRFGIAAAIATATLVDAGCGLAGALCLHRRRNP